MSDIDLTVSIDPERFRFTADQTKHGVRHGKRKSVPFAKVPLDQLTDRRWDEIYPPRVRLWFYLVVKSRSGRNSVRLTNQKAAEIGLDRHGKSRALARLQSAGLVSVIQQGLEAPVISVLIPANPEPDVV